MNEIDIFEAEQRTLEEAKALTGESKAFYLLADEYGKLLKHLRRATRLADRTTLNLHESNLTLNDKAYYDGLTGIYNRRYMEERLTQVIRGISRGGGELSVLMLDVDFFKRYNDTYGHGEGDVCLKAIAAALTESLPRAEDFAARYGGEEFAVILPNTGESGARMMASRILANVSAKNIPHEKNGAAPHVTVSIGATTGVTEHWHKGGDYLKKADEALYQSKHGGRNRYTFIPYHEEEGINENEPDGVQ